MEMGEHSDTPSPDSGLGLSDSAASPEIYLHTCTLPKLAKWGQGKSKAFNPLCLQRTC